MDSGFPGETAGSLPDRPTWRPIELATLSYGYGLSTTALQLARSYAVIASGGIARPVTLLRREGPVEGERVYPGEVSRAVLQMLTGVTSDAGTGTRARINGYTVAGKTGTVHKLSGGAYAENEYLSLFAGMAPASHPRVVTAVVVDGPKTGGYYGGLVAAPVFSAVTAGALRTLNVSPDDLPAVAALGSAGGGVR